MKRIGQLVFLVAAAVAGVLYALTVPDGLPWNNSTHLSLAYLGEILPLPSMPHPFWGFHVRAIGSAISLSVVMASLAAGLLATLVNRYFGWRFAASLALIWTFLPGVWNRAVTGERGICLASMVVVAAWLVNAIMLRVLRKARTTSLAQREQGVDIASAHDVNVKLGRLNFIVSWIVLVASVVFACVSLSSHDYRLGEAASAYAKGVVGEAGKRIIVLNGTCDDQVVAASKACKGSRREFAVLALRNDDAYRTNLVNWAKREWPDETNIWVAATVSVATFVDVATKRHPEQFYLMNGKSTTPEAWERRWTDFRPWLDSTDPFVPIARRLFAYEANVVANALADAKSEKSAWALYKRAYEEVDPGNFSALVNMNELVRRGYAVSGEEKKTLHDKLETFFKDVNHRKRLREIARASGPVRADQAMLEKMAEEAKKRIAAKVAAGEKVEIAPEILSLVEWNNEMVQQMDKGEIAKAGRIARTILSNPQWRGFIAANAVLGAVSAHEGDYVASEAFFRVATDTTNRVATVTLNDYADTLMHLGKLEEAEKMARRAIKESDENFWLARLTLVEVLEKRVGKLERVEVVEGGAKVERYAKPKGADKAEIEIRELIRSVLKHAPVSMRDAIRKEHKDFVK